MRDTFGLMDEPGNRTVEAPKGMRHSIRPRQMAAGKPVAVRPVSQAPRREMPLEAAPMEAAMSVPVAAAPAAPSPVQAIERATRSATAQRVAEQPLVLDRGLPRWHELSLVETGSRQTSRTALPVADAARDSVSVRAFDLLRTRLRQSTQEHGWTNIAVVSPTSGCGNTFTTVNLALSLSRISNSRTILMDLNLRNPGIAKAFDVTPPGAMQDFLSGNTQIGDHIVRVSDTLALGLNNRADQNSADTLQAPETARTLERMRAALQPELVLYDMPAMLAHDDLSAFLPQLDGVLVVSDGTQTMSRDLLECERMLEGKVPLLGVVLNRARKDSIPHYH